MQSILTSLSEKEFGKGFWPGIPNWRSSFDKRKMLLAQAQPLKSIHVISYLAIILKMQLLACPLYPDIAKHIYEVNSILHW